MTGRVFPCLGLTGAKPFATVGDGVVGGKSFVAQFKEMTSPCIGISALFLTQQVAVCRCDIGPDQDWFACLEDFVMCTHLDWGQVFYVVYFSSCQDGLFYDRMDGSKRNGNIQKITKQLDDPTVRAVTEKDEG